MLQFPRWRVDVTVGGDLVKTFYETATTSAAAIGKAKHKMRGAVSSAGAFKFKATKAEAGKPERHHATKAAPKSQREMYYDAERRSGEINKTFLEMLPTMRRRDLKQLIEKRPALWGRFAGYLTSGHVFVDDPPAGARHHSTKKSPAQLQREIDEVLRTSDREKHGYDTERISDREFEQAARFEAKKYGLKHEEALRFVKHPLYLSIRQDVANWSAQHGFPATNSSLTRGYLLDKINGRSHARRAHATIGSQGSTRQSLTKIPSFKISTKAPAAMTAAEINKELDKLDTQDSTLGDLMIEGGRGHERPSEYHRMTDPLSMELRKNSDRRQDLRIEIEMRYGPNPPSRLPTGRGFGPRSKTRSPTRGGMGFGKRYGGD